mmetsp:Transcript_11679/g.31889  ORF Transcript_11679/g.31889 Transcript_11679/m.31889 type:complete len:209 (+) Transcript_11679:543-1169(+)
MWRPRMGRLCSQPKLPFSSARCSRKASSGRSSQANCCDVHQNNPWSANSGGTCSAFFSKGWEYDGAPRHSSRGFRPYRVMGVPPLVTGVWRAILCTYALVKGRSAKERLEPTPRSGRLGPPWRWWLQFRASRSNLARSSAACGSGPSSTASCGGGAKVGPRMMASPGGNRKQGLATLLPSASASGSAFSALAEKTTQADNTAKWSTPL